MSTRAWLAVLAAFAAGWMMRDASEALQSLLWALDLYLRTGIWPFDWPGSPLINPC